MPKKLNLYAEADKAADRYKIPRHIFRALVGAESGWKVDARSPVGATGLTQLMPQTAAGLGVDPLNPIEALDGGARYLSGQIAKFGSVRLGLAAYNAGPGNVEKYGGVPPFKETQRYVTKIMAAAPTQAHAVQAKPNKQQTVTTVPTLQAPPPADLLGPSPLAGDPTSLALEGLRKISAGESPTHTLSSLVSGMMSMPTPVKQQTPQPTPETPATPTVTQPAAPKPAAPLKGGGGWGGSFNVAASLAQIAKGHGLQAVSEKRDRQATKTGGVSDHWVGSENAYAFDLSNGVETPDMDKAAVEIAKRLGVKYDGKKELVLTVNRNGYRIQVLYRTDVGGDHHNHIHVGVKKIG